MKQPIRIALLLSIIFILTACGGGNKVEGPLEEKYTAKSEEVVINLSTEYYEAVYDLFDEVMQDEMPLSDMVQLTQLIQGSGQLKEIGNISIRENNNLYISVASVKYTKENRIFTITFNDEDEIVELYIR